MKERKRHIEETQKLQRLVDKEYDKPEDTRDIPKLSNLETQLNFARNSISNYTNEYTKLLGEQQKISKDLRATREQRIKRIEYGKSSWAGVDQDARRRNHKRKARKINGDPCARNRQIPGCHVGISRISGRRSR